MEEFQTCRVFRSECAPPNNFGGRKHHTAIKTYNLYTVYTIDGDSPSRGESIVKQEIFQCFRYETLKPRRNWQKVKYPIRN